MEQKLCPICKLIIRPEESTIDCPKCGVTHHSLCWEINCACGDELCPSNRKTKYCGFCGSELGADEMFCGQCGHRVEE